MRATSSNGSAGIAGVPITENRPHGRFWAPLPAGFLSWRGRRDGSTGAPLGASCPLPPFASDGSSPAGSSSARLAGGSPGPRGGG
eukprot:1463710-Pyramimonas_sp.AAC.3